jgi:hypothetical protein
MDLTTKLNIARAEQRIAILRNLIATLGAKGLDVSKHQRLLVAGERYLASGCAPPRSPEGLVSDRPTSAVGYTTPPGTR